MKTRMLLILPIAMSGCMAELLTTTAIQGELAARNAQAGAQALNHVKENKARTETEYAIRVYQADKGAYPPSLAALVPGYLPALPKHADGLPFGYDPATGVLLDSPALQRPSITPQDTDNLKRIEDAIFAYWQGTSKYPGTLEDLRPAYMASIPAPASGGAFVYDPGTGAVYHPAEVQAAPPATRAPGAVGAGAGPLGETTAAIGIQQQLQDMNTAGTQAAQGAARRGVRGTQDSYSDAQQRAVDEIDQ